MQFDEYRKLAEVEDRMWYFRTLHGRILKEVEKRLGGKRALSILDAGCGTGGLLRKIGTAHPEWRATGIDASEHACRFASDRAPAPIVRGSVESLPFETGSFDVVVCADVLYHVDSDGAALGEFRRVLRPGGVLILNVPAYPWLWSYHDVATHARRRYSKRAFASLVQGGGFRIERLTHWNTLLFPLIVARRKLFAPPKSGSDVEAVGVVADKCFSLLMGVEGLWLTTGLALPFGSSLFAIAAPV